MTEPIAYAFTNTGVFYTIDGTNYVINTTANSTLSALGKFVLISSDNVSIGNSTVYNYANSTVWTGAANTALVSGASGSNTQIQFNDSGLANGSAGFTFNKTTNVVSVGNTISVGNSTVNAIINSTSFSSLTYVSYGASQSLTANQASQARANIWVTKKNYIINGAMMVSQENGTTVGTTSGYYPVDQFYIGYTTSGTMNIAQVASTTPGGSPNRLRITVTATDTSIAAGDLLYINQRIEGLRIADLRFGSAAAKTVTLQFGVKAPAGTYGVALWNVGTRQYVAEFTISPGEANTDVVKSVTFPGDTTGTWAVDNTLGLQVLFTLMSGSGSQGAAGSWGATGAFTTSNQFNFMGTNGNVFELFDISLTEGSVAPPFQVPDFITELLLCQRYWEKSYSYATAPGTVTNLGMDQIYVQGPAGFNNGGLYRSFKVSKRIAPTMVVYSPTTGASGKIRDNINGVDLTPTVDAIGESAFRWFATQTAAAGVAMVTHWTANSRM